MPVTRRSAAGWEAVAPVTPPTAEAPGPRSWIATRGSGSGCRGSLGLTARGAAATAKGNPGLAEHAVDESVGTARLLRQCPDARSGVVLPLELGCELVPCGTSHPAALFQSLGHPCLLVASALSESHDHPWGASWPPIPQGRFWEITGEGAFPRPAGAPNRGLHAPRQNCADEVNMLISSGKWGIPRIPAGPAKLRPQPDRRSAERYELFWSRCMIPGYSPARPGRPQASETRSP